jgi:glycosyltransferase involved in cell wall biosynthesis
MRDRSESPTFSVIVPTRNRSALFRLTIESILAQDIDDYEIIVIIDGSSAEELSQYAALEAAWAGLPIYMHRLVDRAAGHGPAYSRNFGASLARGRCLCFLDDDDLWIDAGHLRRCRDSIAADGAAIDLYFTDQRALYPDGRPHGGPLWITGLDKICRAGPDALGNRRVTTEELLAAPGFAHLNCSIYRRAFYEAIGGMDEALRYEEDRDMYLRAIDAAAVMLYNPAVVAQHHIPDAQRADNVSTAVNQIGKKLYQLRICDKALTSARRPAVRRYARRAKGDTLRQLAQLLMAAGRAEEAVVYMREALSVSFSIKWLAYALSQSLRVALTRTQR